MDERTVTVIGGGLLGGSMCLALRRARPSRRVVCLDLEDRLEAIRQAGVADAVASVGASHDYLDASRLVILAAPVLAILDLLPTVAASARPGTVVTDVGSTKARIAGRAAEVFPPGVAFVGGHPMAGGSLAGVTHADARLFQDRPYILCPTSRTPERALLAVLDLIDDVGAWPLTLEPEEHDQLVATLSHLPQLVAMTLFATAWKGASAGEMLGRAAGPAFLEMTRVASSPYGVWEGILATNRERIAQALDGFADRLADLRTLLAGGSLQPFWEEVARQRSALSGEPVARGRRSDLRAVVDRCDRRLVSALGDRLEAVRAIGRMKQGLGEPLRDGDREQWLLARWREWGRKRDVPPDLVEILFGAIVAASRRIQAPPPEDQEPVSSDSAERGRRAAGAAVSEQPELLPGLGSAVRR